MKEVGEKGYFRQKRGTVPCSTWKSNSGYYEHQTNRKQIVKARESGLENANIGVFGFILRNSGLLWGPLTLLLRFIWYTVFSYIYIFSYI